MAEDFVAEIKNQSTFDHIEGLMEKARKGRVIERTTRVQIKRPEAPDMTLWRNQGIRHLQEWMVESSDYDKTIEIWEVCYVQCGSCLKSWREWRSENPIGDDLPGWLESATKIVTEKRWI